MAEPPSRHTPHSFVEELRHELDGKEQGYVKIIKVGKSVIPFCIPPQIEVVLLDPAEQTVGYRVASDPDSMDPKKGRWLIGSPGDVVDMALKWRSSMQKSSCKRKESKVEE